MTRPIRVIAIGLFRRGDQILVAEGHDPTDGSRFARPLGGEVEPGERSGVALAREIGEELGAAIVEPRLVGVLENLFEYGGERCHEIVFVYDAAFADRSLYELDAIPIREPGWLGPASWRAPADFDPTCPLVPEGLAALLGGSTRSGSSRDRSGSA